MFHKSYTYLAANFFFYLGDYTSKLETWWDRGTEDVDFDEYMETFRGKCSWAMFKLYQWSMAKSSDIDVYGYVWSSMSDEELAEYNVAMDSE